MITGEAGVHAQRATQLQAVHARKHQVQHDEIHPRAVQGLPHPLAVSHGGHAQPVLLQEAVMRKTTKQVLGIAAASVLIIGATSGAFAHGGFGPGIGANGGGHYGTMAGNGGMRGPVKGSGWMMSGGQASVSDEGLARLKGTLGITPEQESAWSAYAAAVKGRVDLVTSHHRARFSTGTDATDERLNFHQDGLAQMQKVAEALNAALTPEQKSQAGGLLGSGCLAW